MEADLLSTGVVRNVTPDPSVSPWDLECDQVKMEYEVLPAIGFAISFVIGVYYCFFGYRCLRPTLFLTGLLSGAAILAAVCLYERLLPPLGKAGVSLLAGVLCGVISALVRRVGVAVLGIILGGLSTTVMLTVLRLCGVWATRWPAAGSLLGGAIVGVALAMRWPRRMVVVATAVIGAVMIDGTLDYLVNSMAIAGHLRDIVAGFESGRLCWYAWLLLALWPVTAVVGATAQFLLTARGRHYKEVKKKQKKGRQVNIQRQQRGGGQDTPNSRYRHIYQARRANGDVITQNYLLGHDASVEPRIPLHPALKTQPYLHAEQPMLDNEPQGSTNTTLTQVAS